MSFFLFILHYIIFRSPMALGGEKFIPYTTLEDNAKGKSIPHKPFFFNSLFIVSLCVLMYMHMSFYIVFLSGFKCN